MRVQTYFARLNLRRTCKGRNNSILQKVIRVNRRLVLISLVAIIGSGSRPVGAGVNAWTRIARLDGGVSALEVDWQHPNTMYAGTENGVFKTTDGGKQW